MPKLIKPIAIAKCDSRLDDARDALARCDSPSFYDEFVKGWKDYLIAATAVPHILEKAAGATPQARQWYGGIRNAGRKDELIRYMVQARNAEEHGIEPVTEFSSAEWFAQHPQGGMKFSDVAYLPESNQIYFKVGHADPHPTPRYGFKPASIRLARVEDDRFKTVFDPPLTHLGGNINGGEAATPMQAGELFLAYVSRLVREAEALE